MQHNKIKLCAPYFLLFSFFCGASILKAEPDTDRKRQQTKRVIVRNKKSVDTNKASEDVTKTCPIFDNVRVYKIVKRDGCCYLEKITSTPFDTNIKTLEWCSNPQGTFLLVGADPGSNDNDDYHIALYQAAFCSSGYAAPCQR